MPFTMNTINMMRKLLPHSVGLSAILFLFGCSHNLAPVGHYQSDPVTIDGNISDWVLPLRFSNAEYTMHYSVTNDAKISMSACSQKVRLTKEEC